MVEKRADAGIQRKAKHMNSIISHRCGWRAVGVVGCCKGQGHSQHVKYKEDKSNRGMEGYECCTYVLERLYKCTEARENTHSGPNGRTKLFLTSCRRNDLVLETRA